MKASDWSKIKMKASDWSIVTMKISDWSIVRMKASDWSILPVLFARHVSTPGDVQAAGLWFQHLNNRRGRFWKSFKMTSINSFEILGIDWRRI